MVTNGRSEEAKGEGRPRKLTKTSGSALEPRLPLPYFEKLAISSGVVGHVADSGLDHDGLAIVTNDYPVGVDNVVVLEDAKASLALHGFFEVLIG
jgi:hypothetical protein